LRVLADGRHVATPPRSKTPFIVVGALVVVALVVAVFVLAGGDAGSLNPLPDDTPETPEFAFDTSKPKAVETAAEPDHKAAVAAAAAPAEAVTQRLDDLYTAAFLDPGNWMEGSYDDVLTFFDTDAGEAAEEQLDVLTAGSGAGDAFETIRPRKSSLKIQVLLDADGSPESVEGTAKFVARGTGSAGEVTFVSKGQFVFVKDDGEWVVTSFSVRRSDEQAEATPSASASASAEASA
jgi:hypothetical protein